MWCLLHDLYIYLCILEKIDPGLSKSIFWWFQMVNEEGRSIEGGLPGEVYR